MEKTILIPISADDFDPTKVVTPRLRLRAAGFRSVFATPDGKRGRADPLLLSGVLFGMLGAKRDIVANYHLELIRANPAAYGDISATDYDGLLLSGGPCQGGEKLSWKPNAAIMLKSLKTIKKQSIRSRNQGGLLFNNSCLLFTNVHLHSVASFFDA